MEIYILRRHFAPAASYSPPHILSSGRDITGHTLLPIRTRARRLGDLIRGISRSCDRSSALPGKDP